MQDKIRVGLIDLDCYRRSANAQLISLNEHMTVVLESNQFVSDLGYPQTDVLVLAHSSPGQVFGVNLKLDEWRAAFPNTKLILMTSCRASDVINTVWNAGLDGCIISYAATPMDLINMMLMVTAGERCACTTTKKMLAGRRIPVKLSPRELEMIRLIGELGPNSRKQIAHRMGFTANCYSVRMRRIAAKFDVAGSEEVIQRCVDMGLIELRQPLASVGRS